MCSTANWTCAVLLATLIVFYSNHTSNANTANLSLLVRQTELYDNKTDKGGNIGWHSSVQIKINYHSYREQEGNGSSYTYLARVEGLDDGLISKLSENRISSTLLDKKDITLNDCLFLKF